MLKRLKKWKGILALAAVLAVPLGLQTADASASGCTNVQIGTVGRSAYPVPAWFSSSAYLSGCTMVGQVRFWTSASDTYISDGSFTAGPYLVDGAVSFPTPYKVVNGVTSFLIRYDFGCWFNGPRTLYAHVKYQAYNLATGTWGPIHTADSLLNVINGC